MKIAKPTEEDKAYFRSIVPDDPKVTIKPMFGNLGGFVNGNMFMGLFGSDVGVRLEPGDLEALAAVDGVGPFGPAERPMGAYLSMPRAWRDDRNNTEAWVKRLSNTSRRCHRKLRRSAEHKQHLIDCNMSRN